MTLTAWGRWLALHRTWITVVVGFGVDLAILFFILPKRYWATVVEIVVLSSAGIIARSLVLEYRHDTVD